MESSLGRLMKGSAQSDSLIQVRNPAAVRKSDSIEALLQHSSAEETAVSYLLQRMNTHT